MIERYRQWAYKLRSALQSLSTDEDYRYWYDPYWVRAEPYRVHLEGQDWQEVLVHVRNFRDRIQSHRIEVHTPEGIIAEPKVLVGTLPASSRKAFPIKLRAAGSASGVRIVAFDIALDGKRYGEWFDAIVEVK